MSNPPKKVIEFTSISPDLYYCFYNKSVYDRVTVLSLVAEKDEVIVVRTKKEHKLSKLN